jgi:hypothetical protein
MDGYRKIHDRSRFPNMGWKVLIIILLIIGLATVIIAVIAFVNSKNANSHIIENEIELLMSLNSADRNDINTANFLVYIENLEVAFFNNFMSQYTLEDFRNASFSDADYQLFLHIKQHEISHLNSISSYIIQNGFKPTSPCSYFFNGINSVSDFVAYSSALLKIMASSYEWIQQSTSSIELQSITSRILGVISRELSFTLYIQQQDPFPHSRDHPMNPFDTFNSLKPLVVTGTCDYILDDNDVPKNRNQLT